MPQTSIPSMLQTGITSMLQTGIPSMLLQAVLPKRISWQANHTYTQGCALPTWCTICIAAECKMLVMACSSSHMSQQLIQSIVMHLGLGRYIFIQAYMHTA